MNKRPGIMGSIHRAWHRLGAWPNLRLALVGIAILVPARSALSDDSAMERVLVILRQAGGGLLMSKVALAVVLGSVALQIFGIALILFGTWGAIRDRWEGTVVVELLRNRS